MNVKQETYALDPAEGGPKVTIVEFVMPAGNSFRWLDEDRLPELRGILIRDFTIDTSPPSLNGDVAVKLTLFR